MRNPANSSSGRTALGGYALGMAIHVVLLLLILGQVVFLASRYRARIDLTADGLYTLTESTHRVLGGMENRLLIEAYFSPDETVPAAYHESRPNIRNFFDELVQVGNGKVVVQYLNPQEDKEIADQARRLGIQPSQAQDQNQTSVSFTELWQGVRLLYGVEKQKVIPFLDPRFTASAQLEGQLTPAIKEVTIDEKPNIAFMEWQAEPARSLGQNASEEMPQGWFNIRMMPEVQGRYQFTNLSFTETLVPDVIDTLILFRPKDLTDREKYVVDQFLMQGKTLVVFADSMEYEIGQSRRFLARPFSYDAPDSDAVFLDQLAHYGIQVEEKLVADGYPQVQVPIYVNRTVRGLNLQQPVPVSPYPYFFRPVDVDWGSDAIVRQLAPDNPALQQRYKELFRPGIIKTTPLTLNIARMPGQPTGGPGLFWACPVGLVDPLPEGITGEELLYTSPFALLENPPPANVRPMNFQAPFPEQNREFAGWANRMAERVLAAPRAQVPLMAMTRGELTSYFEGKPIPTILGAAENPVQVVDPLALPIQEDPLATPDPSNDEQAAGGEATGTENVEKPTGEGAEKPAGEGQRGGGEGTGTEGAEGAGRRGAEGGTGQAVDAASQDPPEEQDPPTEQDPPQGPPTPTVDHDHEDPDREPDPRFRAAGPARVVVVGDADFLRDDLVGGPRGVPYAQIGGPVSPSGRPFFLGLLDWIYQDDDLAPLHTRATSARVMSFAEQDVIGGERPEQFRERLVGKVSTIRWLNILVPPLLLLAFGAVLALVRHAQKKSFLTTAES